MSTDARSKEFFAGMLEACKVECWMCRDEIGVSLRAERWMHNDDGEWCYCGADAIRHRMAEMMMQEVSQ